VSRHRGPDARLYGRRIRPGKQMKNVYAFGNERCDGVVAAGSRA
jgi:hypothetical protein